MRKLIQTLPEKLVYFFSSLLSHLINGKKVLRNLEFNNILCIKLDEIGDLCYSLHVFKMLKMQYPNSQITLLCKPFALSLTQDDPNITTTTSNWKDIKNDYDLIVDLRGSWKSIFFALKIWPKARLDRGTVRWKNKGNHPHEVITNLQIIEPIISKENQNTQPKIYFGFDELNKVDSFIQTNQIASFAIIHASARKELRKWDKYDLLATFLHQQKKMDILFIGDKNDVSEIEVIQQKLSFNTYNIAGKFNLAEFAALVSKATIYVGNESGPLHIAAVSGAPTLGLYGPGEPFVFYPWSEKSSYLHHVLECNPCDQIHCVHPENPCIKRIQLSEVINKIEVLISSNTTS
jgi:ADP-heptose:LPS heptosyltransferase